MYCMHNTALVRAAGQHATSESEQTNLLAHHFLKDSMEADATTQSEEPAAELTRLTKLLAQKENQLKLLQEKFPNELEQLNSARCNEFVSSNKVLGGIATSFYAGSLCMQGTIINRPEIWSSLKLSAATNFALTWCSLAYTVIQMEIKTCIN